MTNKYDAIIIGAGVIGAPIAYELAKMGLQNHECG
jgi:sarcosine oxidase subunit beta